MSVRMTRKSVARTARGFAAIGLFNPKTPSNVGSVLRAAYCYGAAMVAIEGTRDVKAATDTPKAFRHLPVLRPASLRDVIPYDCVPVAVELTEDARDLTGYTHPERAFYIFGPEDGSLGARVLAWCRDTVYIPTTMCMNLAATANVVLYDRLSKRRGR